MKTSVGKGYPMYFKIDQTVYSNYHVGEGDYPDWSEDTITRLNYATPIPEGYWDVALFPNEVDPKLGDNIFVVWVEYSSGDSFGSSSGNVEFLWAFTDAEKAYKLKELIYKDYRDDSYYNFKSGNNFNFYGVNIYTGTWKGYFESLQTVRVDRLEVKK